MSNQLSAMSRYIRLFFILVWSTSVFGRKCVTYNFENDFEYLFGNNGSICQGIGAWQSGSYSDLGIDSPNAESTKFTSPNALELSCSTSFSFPMEAGGAVEALVYMDSGSISNQLTILASQIVVGGNDPTVGTTFLTPSLSNFQNGWNTLTFNLIGTGSYDGYLTFLGLKSEGSIVLIDSFRYIPPNEDADNCVAYEGDIPTTTEAVTPQPITTTPLPVETEQCFTYQFGSDFDKLFTTDRTLCEGFVPWSFGNYSDIEIDSVNNFESFLSPNVYSSCISTFEFPMSPDGIVEVTVYMDSTSSLDHIIVLAQKVVDTGTDTVAGFEIYEPSLTSFVRGWSTIRIPLVDLSTFNGYLIFLGQAAESSVVLIESFRYIPPWYTEEDDSCPILQQFRY